MPPNPDDTLVLVSRSAPAGWSAEVHEFMSRPPNLMLRSGNLVMAGVLSVLLTLSMVIQYPDTITARASIIGTEPVVEIVARQSGHLEALRVREGQKVKKGELLAVVESPARAETVFALSEKLARLLPDLAGDELTLSVAFRPEDGLGMLQVSYANFLNAYHQYADRLGDNYVVKASALLREQIKGKRAQIESFAQQGETDRRDLAIAREKYERSKVLRERSLLSPAQLNDEEASLLAHVRADAIAQRALMDAGIEAARAEKELRDLEHERAEMLHTARETLRANLNKLRGEIDLWEADYILRAPADGTVAFYDFWNDRQFVTAGRQVFLIVPEISQLLGRMSVSGGGAGKIKPGQLVRIRLDDYPYKEFGVVTGKVQSVSLVARDGANLVLIDLAHPLTTSFRKTLQFKQEMTGQAGVITEQMSLLSRILYEIRRAFVNNA